jgi:hypothetical protein
MIKAAIDFNKILVLFIVNYDLTSLNDHHAPPANSIVTEIVLSSINDTLYVVVAGASAGFPISPLLVAFGSPTKAPTPLSVNFPATSSYKNVCDPET